MKIRKHKPAAEIAEPIVEAVPVVPDPAIASPALNVIRVPISEVVPWKKNPRKINEPDFERLKEQIKRLGIYKPLVVARENGKYIVLGGNMRIRALRDLGYTHVDISIVEAESEAKKIEYGFSDNDRAGFYDEQKIKELVEPHLSEIRADLFKIDLSEPWIDIQKIVDRFAQGVNPAEEWAGMPEFDQGNAKGFRIIMVHFQDQEAVDKFSAMIDSR